MVCIFEGEVIEASFFFHFTFAGIKTEYSRSRTIFSDKSFLSGKLIFGSFFEAIVLTNKQPRESLIFFLSNILILHKSCLLKMLVQSVDQNE